MIMQVMDETLNMDDGIEEEADEEVNKILMEVAGVRLEGMSLVPANSVGSYEESVDDVELEEALRQIYCVSKQT